MFTLSKPKFSTDELLQKLSYIQTDIDPQFRLILNPEWNSKNTEYRTQIRGFMEKELTAHFSREQLALLYDLNWIPECETGYLSISHCQSMGGFSFSKFKHGFDVEEMSRISVNVLRRTCSEEEINTSLKPEFLWVAKEAGIKALSGHSGHTRSTKPLVVTDLVATAWDSHFENRVFSFRLKSEKTLDFSLNKGFIFSEGVQLFCIYFK
ncbi:MAG: hypothetical protein ACXVAX_03965 [Pseudobdellovibrio sp.]